jgi:hypothetical protein
MKTRPAFHTVVSIAFWLSASSVAFAQTNSTSPAPAGGKELLIPDRIMRVPATNDFNQPDSEYSFKRSKSSDHFVLFWAKEYGDDPMTNAIANRRFNVDEVLKEADRFYNY